VPVLLFALPATAIAGAWLEGHPLTFLGGVEMKPWIAASHDFGAAIATIQHGWAVSSMRLLHAVRT